MQLKKKLIKEIDKFNSRELVEIYNLILLVGKQQKHVIEPFTSLESKRGYLKVRNALKNYHGNLSDEIIDERQERL